MGTRADFYIREDNGLEWKGSIAWEGYPSGIDVALLKARTTDEFAAALDAFLSTKDCSRRPEDGWPWPQSDSRTTDYAYVFDGDRVIAYSFGYGPFDPKLEEPEWDEEGKALIFPNMESRARVTDGGFIIITAPSDGRATKE